jgi:hypothetical protein
MTVFNAYTVSKAIDPLCKGYGLHLEENVEHLPTQDAVAFRIRMPLFRARMELDSEMWMVTRGHTDTLVDMIRHKLETHQHQLFRAARAHIAKHDKSPTERLDQIERAAKELLAAIATDPLSSAAKQAAADLGQLVGENPGSVSWEPA